MPQFFPLYVQSRLHDLAEIQKPAGPCGTLDGHVLFSSGWEWGYWLNDVASLRGSYELQANLLDAFTQELAPDLGAGAAALVERLARAQHDYVMIEELTGYLVGRDSVIDLGRKANIISQPDRITFDQLAVGEALAEVDAMLPTLAAYKAEVDAMVRELDGLRLPETRWGKELRAGFEIDLLRTKFVEATYQAALAHLDGDDKRAKARYAAAEDYLDDAREIVGDRHGDLHDAHERRVLDRTPNQTFYQFGYLYFADSLCYWKRELDQVGGMLGSTSVIPPSCFF